MRQLIIAFAIILTGCLDETTIGKPIDVELQPYVDLYLKHCKTFKRYCKVKTGVVFASNLMLFHNRYIVVPKEINSTTLGITNFHLDTIFISEKAWERLSEGERIYLIFHELGHAHLKRQHKNEKYKGYTLSIMNPYLASYDKLSIELQAAYIAELFTNDDKHLKEAIDNVSIL
jgi:hypothetical protein